MAQTVARTRSFARSWLCWALLLPLVTTPALMMLVSGNFRPHINEQRSMVPINYFDKFSQILGISKGTTNVLPGTTALFLNAVKSRRSWYSLDKNLPISQDEIVNLVQDAMQAVPSAFNSQTNRAVVLFGAEHEKLWGIVTENVRARVTADQWIATSQKIAGFKAAAGTVRSQCLALSTRRVIHLTTRGRLSRFSVPQQPPMEPTIVTDAAMKVLFFVDTAVVQSYAENVPPYAAEFPVWATQADAMLQHTIWTALSTQRIGANLQHYNPMIDVRVAEAWSLPVTWRLTAELVFGGAVGSDPSPKEKGPVTGKVQVFGIDEIE